MTSLKSLDSFLTKFALEHNMTLERDNAKGKLISGFEDRCLCWNKNELEYLIQIFPDVVDNQIAGWKIWICAFYDEGGVRFKWKKTLLKSDKHTILSVAKNEITAGFEALENLERGDLHPVQDV